MPSLASGQIDTGAYLIGRAMAEPNLAPRISPKQDARRVPGGLHRWYGSPIWYGIWSCRLNGKQLLNGYDALLLAIAVALATPVGDLFEIDAEACRQQTSRIPRTLLGEQRRHARSAIDSILLATPVMYLGCYFTGIFCKSMTSATDNLAAKPALRRVVILGSHRIDRRPVARGPGQQYQHGDCGSRGWPAMARPAQSGTPTSR